jgi:hypothetical protein
MLLIGEPGVEPRSGDSNLLSYIRVMDDSARIRYLACFVSAGPGDLNERSRDSIEELWRTDECLRRVSRWTEAGRDGGKSPDMLLADHSPHP